MFLSVIFSIWLILAVIYSFKAIKYGVAIFLAYLILVPRIQITIGSLYLGENAVSLLILISYILYARKKGITTDWKPFKPVVIYYLVCLFSIFFQQYLQFEDMINMWRVSTMRALLVPFVVWNVAKNDETALSLFRNTLLICIAISVTYGLFLTTTGGLNPYQFLCLDIFGTTGNMDADYYESYYASENTGRMFGRISSVFLHPMTYALFLGFTFVYLFYNREKINRIVFFILLIGTGLMAILCGVRSVIGALGISVAYYFLIGKNYKIMVTIIAILLIGNLVIEQIPQLNTYVSSITDVKNENQGVGGSSWEMRFEQLNGAINEASKSPFWGLGYGWTVNYMSTKGAHPVCLCFESLIYMVICNNGLVGILLWLFVFSSIYKYNRKHISEYAVINALLVFYISYVCITGDYEYMRYFLIFNVLMLAENRHP